MSEDPRLDLELIAEAASADVAATADATATAAGSRFDLDLLAGPDSPTVAATPPDQALQMDVARVLKGDSMRMAFQPIVKLESRACIGYEALARFPTEDIVSPQAWFAAAAAQGFAHELEMVAVAAALSQLGDLPKGAFVSVNVSPITAGSPELAELIGLKQRKRVVFDIKEGAAIEDYANFTGAIDELRATGVRIALDDAGIADVSLRHMLHLRPDIIKIDTDVTRGVDHDAVKQAIVMAFQSLAQQAGALSLAEGIETEEELETLRSLKVDLGQGYLLGRPTYLESRKRA